MGIFETKDEYDKFINPEEYSRRIALVKKGIENSKLLSARKKRYIEAKSRWNRRKEVTENYDI